MTPLSLEMDMSLWTAIAAFGFTGSLHCTGMCGPLAAAACRTSMPLPRQMGLYIFARLSAYGLLGLCSGFVGQILFRDMLSVSSRTLALVLGLLMVVYASFEWMRALIAYARKRPFRSATAVLKESAKARRFLGLHRLLIGAQNIVQKLNLPLPANLGIVTALLPCGFLYAALAQATLIGQPVSAGIAMIIFAVTTSPALLLGALGASYWQRISPRHVPLISASLLLAASLSVLYRGVTKPHHHDHTTQDEESPHEHVHE